MGDFYRRSGNRWMADHQDDWIWSRRLFDFGDAFQTANKRRSFIYFLKKGKRERDGCQILITSQTISGQKKRKKEKKSCNPFAYNGRNPGGQTYPLTTHPKCNHSQQGGAYKSFGCYREPLFFFLYSDTLSPIPPHPPHTHTLLNR